MTMCASEDTISCSRTDDKNLKAHATNRRLEGSSIDGLVHNSHQVFQTRAVWFVKLLTPLQCCCSPR